MALIEADVLNAVRIALGNPSTSEYSDSNALDAIRRGLTEYSKYRPLRKIGSFETVVDQQQYDIGSSYSYLIGVQKVFWGSTGEDVSGFYGNIYDRLLIIDDDNDLNDIYNESLRVIDGQARGALDAATRYEISMVDDFTVALVPTPEDIRTVYFTYTLRKTLADTRESEYQDIVDFSFLQAAMALANRRHKILQLNSPGTGFIMWQGGRFLKDQVDEARKRLQASLGVNTLVTHG